MYAWYITADPRRHEERQIVFYATDDTSARAVFARFVDAGCPANNGPLIGGEAASVAVRPTAEAV